MAKLYLVTWHMDGKFELQADSEDEVHEIMKTVSRQELALKAQDLEYDLEPIDRSGLEPER